MGEADDFQTIRDTDWDAVGRIISSAGVTVDEFVEGCRKLAIPEDLVLLLDMYVKGLEEMERSNAGLKESMDGRATAGFGVGLMAGVILGVLPVWIGVLAIVFGVVLVLMGGTAAMKNDARIGYRRPDRE